MNWLVPLDIGIISGLIMGLAVLALACAYRFLNFPDLTIEGSLLMGAAVFARLVQLGWSPLLAAVMSLVAGALTGALTGFIHVRFRLNKFLAGIIVVAITWSLGLRLMGVPNISLLQSASLLDRVAWLDKAGGWGYHPGTILLLGTILFIISVSLFVIVSSRPGMRLRVAGSNPEYARQLGINVSLNIILGLALTNSLAAGSGMLLATHQGFTDIGMGQGVLILALAALTIGERLLPEKHLSVTQYVILSAVVGSLLYHILAAGALSIGLAASDLRLATALLVLLVVAFRVTRDGDDFWSS